MNSTTQTEDKATLMLDDVTAYGRALLAQQMRAVVGANIEQGSDRHQTIKDLFVVGAMCKVCEQLALPITPEDSAFECLKKMQVDEGASRDAAEKHIAALKRAARSASVDGKVALKFGREFATGECALAALLAAFAAKQNHSVPMRFLLSVMAASTITLVAMVALAIFTDASATVAWAVGYASAWLVLWVGVAWYVVKLIPKRV